MASYSYQANNPVIPPNQADQAAFPNYDFSQQQWNQANTYGQPAMPAANYQQPNAYGATPQFNYGQQPAAAPVDNNYGSSYGGYKKNDNYKGGNSNFRNNQMGTNKGNFNKGPRNNFGSGIEEQQDTIFVSGLAEDTTEDQIKDHFGSIGIIKLDKKTRKPKIWIYKDKETGKPKGECTITYDDLPTASSAINWFNGKELNGAVLKVELAQRKNNFLASGGERGGDRGGRGGGNSSFGNRGGNRDFDRNKSEQSNEQRGNTATREGDWICSNPSCKNNNFAWRNNCNRCKTDKPAGTDSSSNFSSDRRQNLPYERRGPNRDNSGGRGGGSMGNRDRNSFGGSRNNSRNGNDRSFNRERSNPRGQMRNSNDSRSRPY